ncbi:MAG: iron ABC transporter permease [Treponema sp.]|nr:iron ABC transporter permease [Treponema sp.]
MLKWTDGSKSFVIAWFAVVLFFAVCIIFPLVCVALTPGADDVAAVFTTERFLTAMRNTVLICLCSTFFSVLVGYVYAYAVERGMIPFRRFFSVLPVAHLVTPPFVGGLSFILLVGRNGFITHTLLGRDVSLYGFWGLLLAQVLCFFPIAYLMCLQTLRGINPTLEQAARGMGAGRGKIFLTVTLPLSLPGIASALLYIAVSVLSDFGNPMIVAGRFRVLAVEVYTQLTGWLNGGVSAVLGLLLVLPSVVLFFLQARLLSKNSARIATIGGKSQAFASGKPHPVVRLLLTAFCALVALCLLSQLAALVAGSLQTLWGVNTRLTLSHLAAVPRYSAELCNTLGMSLCAALCSTLLAAISAYLVQRTTCPLRRFIEIFSQLPAAIPGSLFGLAFSLAVSRSGLRLPHLSIVIAMIVGFMPFAYRILSSSYAQLKTTLDDGARSLGASRLYVLATVLSPLTTGSLFYSFIYTFVRGVGTVSAVIFLVSFRTPLASVRILNLAEQGDWGKAAALALILTLLVFIILGAGKICADRVKAHLWSMH